MHFQVIINLAQYFTSCIAIPIIHKVCDAMAERGRVVTLLHRFLIGHVFMIVTLLVDTLIYYAFKLGMYSLHSHRHYGRNVICVVIQYLSTVNYCYSSFMSSSLCIIFMHSSSLCNTKIRQS